MAYKIVWAHQASDDLRNIIQFILLHNPTAARQLAVRLIAKVDPLAQFPLMGRVVPELNEQTIREIVLRPYRIIYHVNQPDETIAIARIWHGARGTPELEPNSGQ